MVQNGSGRGHDRVLGKFKIWKAKVRLKASSARGSEPEKQRDVLGLFNKAQFELDLPTVSAASSKERPCSLLFLDLDKFKSINDTLGHQAGDRVLKERADALLRACSGKGMLYRNGGDEFCVLLPNYSFDEALAVANRILREVRAIRTKELPNGLSTSIGAACSPDSAGNHSELLSRADEAMYASKRAGGNQVSKADSAARRTSEMETLSAAKNIETDARDKPITESSLRPYTEDLRRTAKQVIDYEMTLEGRHVLRHLMRNEPVEVLRSFLPEVPTDRTNAQLLIAKQRGLVKHKVEGRGARRTYWIINPQFREVLEDVLYEGGTN